MHKYEVNVIWTKSSAESCEGIFNTIGNTEKEAVANYMFELFKTENMIGWTLSSVKINKL